MRRPRAGRPAAASPSDMAAGSAVTTLPPISSVNCSPSRFGVTLSERRGLKIAVVARGFEPRAAELRRDELGGNVEFGRRRAAAPHRVRCQERDVGLQVVGGELRRDLLRRRSLRGNSGRSEDGSAGRRPKCVDSSALPFYNPSVSMMPSTSALRTRTSSRNCAGSGRSSKA